MKERRRAIRIPIGMILDVIKQGKVVESFRAAGINLSLKGVCIETSGELNKNDKILLKITLPIDVVGEVVWSKVLGTMKRYGVKFIKLGFIDKLSLKKYIKARIENK
jgi:citrate lyase gamma subunit